MRLAAANRLAIEALLPYLALLAVSVFGVSVIQWPGLQELFPVVGLCTTLLMSLSPHKTLLLPLPAVFICGLLIDSLTGVQMGAHAGVLVALQWLLFHKRRDLRRRSFVVRWAVCFLVQIFVYLGLWGIFSALTGALMPLLPLFISAAIATALYPCFDVLIYGIMRGLRHAAS